MCILSATPLKKKVEVNIQFLNLQMETKKCPKTHKTWDKIKNEIEKIIGGKKFKHGKEFINIKFDSGDILSLNYN